jgi:hypothetical protein
MPRGDGTGPMGMGPMTGRGFGFCAGYAYPGFYFGRGFRRHAFGPMYSRYPAGAFVAPTQEGALREQAEYLEEQLRQVNRRLDSLEKDEG